MESITVKDDDVYLLVVVKKEENDDEYEELEYDTSETNPTDYLDFIKQEVLTDAEELTTLLPVIKTSNPSPNQKGTYPRAQRRKRTGEYETCPICAKSIKHVAKHIRLTHQGRRARSERTFNCDLCSASYKSKRAVEAHLNAHYNRRPYKCPHCPYAYTSFTALRQHKLKHSDVRFVCPDCGKTTHRKDSLDEHMKRHQGPQHFCDECPQRYTLVSQLRTHKRVIHGDGKKKCTLCPKEFNRFEILKGHMMKVHGFSIISKKMFYNNLPKQDSNTKPLNLNDLKD